jgi:hypothetical protein
MQAEGKHEALDLVSFARIDVYENKQNELLMKASGILAKNGTLLDQPSKSCYAYSCKVLATVKLD